MDSTTLRSWPEELVWALWFRGPALATSFTMGNLREIQPRTELIDHVQGTGSLECSAQMAPS